MTEQILRAAIYIRVSTAEQAMHGKSLQAQLDYLQKYADEHNMKVVGVYADEGQTARKELKKRKAIHRLLSSVERNEIDVILFWRMDRWFRSVSDFYKVQDILDAHGTRWISTSEPNINMETRDGRLSLNLVLTIGQNEVDTTSERIRFTVDNMIKNGRLVWGESNLPFGYSIKEVDGRKIIVKNEEEAPMVEEFYRYFLKHNNKSATVRHMQETFGIDFSYSILRTMLSSEFYIGKYRDNTNYCPAYLSLEEWEKVQSIAKRNVKGTRSGRIYIFSGMIRCPLCGQKLVGTGCSSIINRETREKRTYNYYRCNRALIDHLCDFRHRMSQNLVEEYLLNNLANDYYKFKVEAQNVAAKKAVKKKTRSADQINAEIGRLNNLYLKGRIAEDMYEEEYQKLKEELENVSSAAPRPAPLKNYDNLERLLASDFRKLYSELNPENRQAFWRSIIEQIYIDRNGHITGVKFF